MKNHLNFTLYQFIKDKKLSSKKLLVAVSSGLDSMVLISELIKLKDKLSLELHIVHVNHGWRKESDDEYLFLESFSKVQGVSFHGKSLDMDKTCHDLENQSRSARYAFFKEIYQKIGADALFLAHHKQDLEETVVKRVFEGANLLFLGGMRPISDIFGMVLCRPFLDIDKSDLYKKAAQDQITYFEDVTNHDSRFLRARMRKEFFPFCESIFKKNIHDSLATLSHRAWLLNDYFKAKFSAEVKVVELGIKGDVLLFKKDLHPFEIMNFLLIFSKDRSTSLGSHICESLAKTINKGTTAKKFLIGEKTIEASKNFCVFWNGKDLKNNVITDKDGLDLFIKDLPKWFCKKYFPSLITK